MCLKNPDAPPEKLKRKLIMPENLNANCNAISDADRDEQMGVTLKIYLLSAAVLIGILKVKFEGLFLHDMAKLIHGCVIW